MLPNTGYIHNEELSSRVSELLLFDMYVLDAEFGVSPHDILSSIANLEAGEPLSGIKPATMFKNPPLKGLWHKHYFAPHFVGNNISWLMSGSGVLA